METLRQGGGVDQNDGGTAYDALTLQALHDGFAAASEELEEVKRKYQEEFSAAATRRKEFAEAIVKAMEGVLAEYRQAPSMLNLPTSTTPANSSQATPTIASPSHEGESTSQPEQPVKNTETDGKSSVEVLESLFAKRGELKKAILSVFSVLDTFLSTDEIINYLVRQFPQQKIDKKQVIDTLKDARRSKSLIGYRYYENNTLKYLNGLPSFFLNVKDYSNVEDEEIKPDYRDRLRQRVSGLNSSEMVK